jgi:O-acetyl-ADP-ribose deacetylase (regulator of RNase III)
MIEFIPHLDIAYATADLLVHSSNGIGYMGGADAVRQRMNSPTYHIQHASRGQIERIAQDACRHQSVIGYAAGDFFITEAPNLKANSVFHAVVTRFPWGAPKAHTLVKLCDALLAFLDENPGKYNSIALPYLNKPGSKVTNDVMKCLYETRFADRPEMFYVYEYKPEV